MPAAHDIYAEQLSERCRGYPLYYPEPAPIDGPMQIGDVGFLRQGAFYRLFNVSLSHDDPAQRYGVPVGYERLDLGCIRPYDAALEPGPLHSKTVFTVEANVGGPGLALPVDASFHFRCTSKRGAILMQETQMMREEAVQTQLLEGYLHRHCQSWYDFAKEKHFSLGFGQIMLVTECSKTAAWSSAVYSNSTKEFSVSFSVGNAFVPSAPTFSASAGLEKVGSIERRRSAQHPVGDGAELPKDHTVFFKAYHLGMRKAYVKSFMSLFVQNRNPKMIKAFGGPLFDASRSASSSHPSNSCPELSKSGFSQFSLETRTHIDFPDFHPISPLLALIMENTNEQFVFLHDDEWCSPTPDASKIIDDYMQFYFEAYDALTDFKVQTPPDIIPGHDNHYSSEDENTLSSYVDPESSSTSSRIEDIRDRPFDNTTTEGFASPSLPAKRKNPPLHDSQEESIVRRACSWCRSLKMKCQFVEGSNTCQRCMSKGRKCVPYQGPGRKNLTYEGGPGNAAQLYSGLDAAMSAPPNPFGLLTPRSSPSSITQALSIAGRAMGADVDMSLLGDAPPTYSVESGIVITSTDDEDNYKLAAEQQKETEAQESRIGDSQLQQSSSWSFGTTSSQSEIENQSMIELNEEAPPNDYRHSTHEISHSELDESTPVNLASASMTALHMSTDDNHSGLGSLASQNFDEDLKSTPILSPQTADSGSDPQASSHATFILDDQTNAEIASLRQKLYYAEAKVARYRAALEMRASDVMVQQPAALSVPPYSSGAFQQEWKARTDARTKIFCSMNRAGNALCAWHNARRERRAFPPRNAPAGYLNCGCTHEEALFEESLARHSVGGYRHGENVRMDPALRNPLLKLLQQRYGYQDGDFELNPNTGEWFEGESAAHWEAQVPPGLWAEADHHSLAYSD